MTKDNGKPRGACTGCKFEYQLGTARSGEYKGELVVRKHNSRTGPGLCEGAAKPPAIIPGDAQAFADPAAAPDLRPPLVRAEFDSMGSCGHDIMAGEEIRSDGAGGWLCGLCSDEGPAPDRPQHVYDNGRGGVYVHEGTREACRQDECVDTAGCACGGVDPGCPNGCGTPTHADLPHDRGPETVTHIPNGHDFTDSSGTTWRHGGAFAECTVPDCVQFRNRISPPPVSTPVQHQCSNGLFADMRNCPEHGVVTPVEPVTTTLEEHGVVTPVEPVTTTLEEHGVAPFADPYMVTPGAPAAGHLNGVPMGHTHYGEGDGLHPGRKEDCTLSPCWVGRDGLTFADPTPAPADLPPVSGQPEPERDRWGRYKILGVSHTRATTFAKLGSSTYALGEWNERMLIAGLVKRPDLLAMAHGLDVKRDRDTLNKIADDAQEHAGNKVAANIGTAYHSFTERLDAGLCTLDDVPEQWRARCAQYVNALAQHGLSTWSEWIERTTAVRADQVSAEVPVAGTLDRIFQLPNGELVIGDLKTSSNIDYSWSEIAVQLALYAHGVNTHGLFDWNRKKWDQLSGNRKVRTDYAIVMHLPADGDGCTLYRVDIERGWKFAQVSGMVQTRQKAKNIAGVLPTPQLPTPVPVVAAAVQQAEAWAGVPQVPAPQETPEMANARRVVNSCADRAALGPLYDYAVSSGLYSPAQLDQIRQACADRWAELQTGLTHA